MNTKNPKPDMFAEAARKYLEAKRDWEQHRNSGSYRNQKWVEAGVRSDFRGISGALTKKMGVSLIAEDAVGKLEIEHAIVLNLVHNHILETPFEQEELAGFLQINMVGVFVTHDQHSKLNATKMPFGWKWGDDPLARYNEANIKVLKHL